ncbi:MAG: Flavin-containing monoamine oxidase AofH [Hydrocarboniphaga sp.]|uniref:protoporphyrinogen/coproporphyrinogen oxidase n=1 Tax=Hydrocarboniphaga sp. TaxID=2033016 RepID=UPI002637BBD7|nr:NAD(P)/FAD-dependent oxidoreductase [Hydrocarboniphaga sp.]MDB5971493.1 Flavin-containing monoamine oxidase AofH [Hydrocarboniphaga sp.]
MDGTLINDRAPSVAIIGAGLSGLSAAYRLRKQGWKVGVFESSGLAGGRVQTVHYEGYVIDTGASALAESYRGYLQLARELGLGAEIEPAMPAIGIVRDGTIHLLRTNRMMRTGITTGLLSWTSKIKLLRLGFDIVHAKLRGRLDYADMRRAAPLDTESARDYALRVLNGEIDSYLGDPIARTMLITDTDKISKVELFSGLANIMSTRILAMRGGQGRLPEMLAALVKPQLECPVLRVTGSDDHVEVEYRPSGATDSAVQRFDACVVCCPLFEAVKICPDLQALLQPLSSALRYTKAITVAVATRIRPSCPAFLVQLPSCEDPDIALMFVEHNKCADRAPPGRGLIGVDWEATASERFFDASDEDIVAHTLKSVIKVFPELGDQIEFTQVTRWAAALPLTGVGAYRRIGEFNAALDPKSRLQFAADYMSAAGQNTAVEMGARAAARITANFARPAVVR